MEDVSDQAEDSRDSDRENVVNRAALEVLGTASATIEEARHVMDDGHGDEDSVPAAVP